MVASSPVIPRCLTIATSDSGGGAGIQADLKAFSRLGCHGMSAVAALTAQNTTSVTAVHEAPPDFIRAQLDALYDDIGVDAAKTGMLASAPIVEAVAGAMERWPIPHLVVDPVFISKHGDTLLTGDSVDAMRDVLFPHAEVVTPNLHEAAALAKRTEIRTLEEMADTAKALHDLGPRTVLVKGGHLGGDTSPDCLVTAGAAAPVWLEGQRLPGSHTHGTGCVLSAAVCAELARGMDPADACVAARHFCQRAIAAGVPLGSGVGPVDPGWERSARAQ